ncbi:MAG: hypothetical protein K0M45_00950 [Candidatus Paracaedibacteraceae bacterium]|nr:hypothetical protein [Candidatus Paracaedibacteraceae bacterium]
MNNYHKILLSTILPLANSLGWTMDDPRQPTSVSAVYNKEERTLEESEVYLPALETGFLSSYETKISDKEWDQVEGFLQKPFEDSPGVIKLSAAHFYAQAKYAAKHYYALYKLLMKSEAKVLDSPDKDKLIPRLSRFVKFFESTYDFIKSRARIKAIGTPSNFQDEIFPIVQKTFNTYMRAYEKLKRVPLEYVEDLHFSQPDFIPSRIAHLFYTRDENGFILFNLMPHTEVERGVFRTYIPYGNIDKRFFVERHFLFSLNSDNKPVLIEDKGYCINKSEGVYNISFYSGNTGIVPYSLGKTIITRRNAENPVITMIDKISQILRDPTKLDSLNNSSNISPDAELKLEEHSSERREDSGNLDTILEGLRNALRDNLAQISSDSTLYSLHHLIANIEEQFPKTIQDQKDINALLNIVDSLLESHSSKFLGVPGSPLDILETEYLFLKELCGKGHYKLDPNMQFLLEYIKQEFPLQTLDEVVIQYEEELITCYKAEEEENLENEYKAEQERRSQMVINGDHYKKKQSHKKPSPGKGNYRKAKPQEESAATKNGRLMKQQQEAKRRAEQRFKKIKEIKIDESPKFRKYLKLVNKVTQGLYATGTNVTAQLNRSSHGNLAVQGGKISIVRPHGRHNTVHQSSARDLIGRLVQTYFDTVFAQPSALGEK